MAELKCPWRTTTRNVIEDGEYKSYVEFSDCLKNECPYYGKTVLQHRPMGGFETVTEPICRRGTMADCKWMQDEFCVNDQCPMCADYCPVADVEGVCKFEERGDGK